MISAITITGTISLGSIGTFLVACSTAYVAVRTKKQTNTVESKVDDTHELVNNTASNLAVEATAQAARVEQLGEAITDAGGKLPPRPEIAT